MAARRSARLSCGRLDTQVTYRLRIQAEEILGAVRRLGFSEARRVGRDGAEAPAQRPDVPLIVAPATRSRPATLQQQQRLALALIVVVHSLAAYGDELAGRRLGRVEWRSGAKSYPWRLVSPENDHAGILTRSARSASSLQRLARLRNREAPALTCRARLAVSSVVT